MLNTCNPWIEKDPDKIFYASYQDMMANFRRPISEWEKCGRYDQKRVYVVEWPEYVKIGISTNPKQRIQSFHQMRNIRKIFISPCEALTCHLEVQLHKDFADHRFKGEYFKVPFDEVINHIWQKYPFLFLPEAKA